MGLLDSGLPPDWTVCKSRRIRTARLPRPNALTTHQIERSRLVSRARRTGFQTLIPFLRGTSGGLANLSLCQTPPDCLWQQIAPDVRLFALPTEALAGEAVFPAPIGCCLSHGLDSLIRQPAGGLPEYLLPSPRLHHRRSPRTPSE